MTTALCAYASGSTARNPPSSSAIGPSIKRDQCDTRPSVPPSALVVTSNHGAPASNSRTCTKRNASSESMNSNVRPVPFDNRANPVAAATAKSHHTHRGTAGIRTLCPPAGRLSEAAIVIVNASPDAPLEGSREWLKFLETMRRNPSSCRSIPVPSPTSRQPLSEYLPFQHSLRNAGPASFGAGLSSILVLGWAEIHVAF